MIVHTIVSNEDILLIVLPVLAISLIGYVLFRILGRTLTGSGPSRKWNTVYWCTCVLIMLAGLFLKPVYLPCRDCNVEKRIEKEKAAVTCDTVSPMPKERVAGVKSLTIRNRLRKWN